MTFLSSSHSITAVSEFQLPGLVPPMYHIRCDQSIFKSDDFLLTRCHVSPKNATHRMLTYDESHG